MNSASVPCVHLADPILSDDEARNGVRAVIMPVTDGAAVPDDARRPPVAICETCLYVALRVANGQSVVSEIPGGPEVRGAVSAALDLLVPGGRKITG